MTSPDAKFVEWDDAKRSINLDKHGLDFIDAILVLDSPYRLDVDSIRGNELRVQSFAYVFEVLTVLTVVHVERGDVLRIVSFRAASNEERLEYHDWLENDYQDAD